MNALTKKTTTLLAIAALALTFLGCSSDSDSGGGESGLKKGKITGVSQKGPFVKGAKVKLYELDANLKKPANPSFTGEVIDNNGNFEISVNKELATQYIVIEASGKYINEVTGEVSSEPITLSAISDVKEKDNVNVNVLTHLEQERVVELAESGKTFEAAKQEAQKEVLTALGMDINSSVNSEDMSLFGGSKSDSLLLAASVMLQADRNVEDVSALLADFSKEIKETGTVSSSIKDDIAAGAAEINIDSVMSSIVKNPPATAPSSSSSNNATQPSSSSDNGSATQSSGSEVTASSSSGSESTEIQLANTTWKSTYEFGSMTISFSAKNTFVLNVVDLGFPEEPAYADYSGNYYMLSGNTISLSGDLTETATISGNTLTLWGETFTKQ